MKKKILFVLTSNDKKGSAEGRTGFYLGEAAHPWKVLKEAGYEIDFASPEGGKPPVDGFDLEDEVNKEFWENEAVREKLDETEKLENVVGSDYEAILLVGGHGTMWDFPENEDLQRLVREIYEGGGVVSAVCHGPSGLVNVKLSDGEYLVKGKKVNGFTNEEECAVGLEEVVPFLLEDKLKERRCLFEKSGKWKEHVAVDERLVTGQNPASAKAVGEAVRDLLS